MNPLIEQLQTLLGPFGGDLARECKSILKKKSTVVTSVEVPLQNAREIYLRRAALNSDLGEPIKGFDEVVKNLNSETLETVGIQSVEGNGKMAIIFTSPDLSRLIGFLLIS